MVPELSEIVWELDFDIYIITINLHRTNNNLGEKKSRNWYKMMELAICNTPLSTLGYDYIRYLFQTNFSKSKFVETHTLRIVRSTRMKVSLVDATLTGKAAEKHTELWVKMDRSINDRLRKAISAIMYVKLFCTSFGSWLIASYLSHTLSGGFAGREIGLSVITHNWNNKFTSKNENNPRGRAVT